MGDAMHGPRPLLPILMTLAGLASFSVMDGTMKAAALALGAFAAIFWRSTVGALAIAPLWLRETVTQRGGRLPPHAALRVHVLRGVVSAAMAILFFDGVVRMPLAQGMALSFIAPLIALYLAAFTLGERLSRRAVLGSLLALVGVGVIAADQLGAIDIEDARGGVRVVGQDRQLPALPGACIDAHAFQNNGQKPGGDFLAGRDYSVVFTRIVQHRRIAAPSDQLVGHPRHGGNDDGHVMAGIDLALDMARHVADAVEIGDRRPAEFHHQASHDVPGRAERR